MPDSRIVAISNQKGGVGKTTTAVTLAHGLSLRGHTVVLVDLDAQGNVAPCLGIPPAPAVFQVLAGHVCLADELVEARPNLWVLPGNPATAHAKSLLAGQPYRERILARALQPVEAEFVIIDTGPSRDVLHDNAHEAAGEIVVPVALDHLALIGVAQEFESLKVVRQNGHAVEVVAVLPTFWDTTTNESALNLTALAERFGDLVLPGVPRTVRLREAPAHGLTIWEYLPASHPAAVSYTRLVERVLHER